MPRKVGALSISGEEQRRAGAISQFVSRARSGRRGNGRLTAARFSFHRDESYESYEKAYAPGENTAETPRRDSRANYASLDVSIE